MPALHVVAKLEANATNANLGMVGWQFSNDSRSTFDILWTCLLTLFACVWTVIHLNIPSPTDSTWVIFRRKAKWMLLTLIAPEILNGVAWGQNKRARDSVKKMHELGYTKWTRANGFFVNMGGFVLVCKDHEPIPLNFDALYVLLKDRHVMLPAVADIDKDIEATSKADHFAKGFVCLQAGWLIVQCAVRAGNGLPITELELATCAFVACTILTYGLWWDKPLDIRFATPIVYCGDSTQDSVEKNEGQSSATLPTTIPSHSLSMFSGKPSRLPPSLLARLLATSGPNYWPEVLKQQRILNFTGVRGVFVEDTVFLYVGSAIFGAIHCAGWNFGFPTQAELVLWRVCSVITTCSLMLFGLSTLVVFKQRLARIPWIRYIWDASNVLFVGAYFLARLALLTEIFLCLRSQPAAIYVTTQWISFIPHLTS